jgi:hypothetical protein
MNILPSTLLGVNWNFCAFCVRTADRERVCIEIVEGNFQKEQTPHMVHADTLPGDHHPASQNWQTVDVPAATIGEAVPAEHPVQRSAFPSE